MTVIGNKDRLFCSGHEIVISHLLINKKKNIEKMLKETGCALEDISQESLVVYKNLRIKKLLISEERRCSTRGFYSPCRTNFKTL